MRESDFVYLMKAGPEISVDSTKAFTVQLTALLILCVAACQAKQTNQTFRDEAVEALLQLPESIQLALTVAEPIKALADKFADKHHALFLGRGDQYPIAMEGALKLKRFRIFTPRPTRQVS